MGASHSTSTSQPSTSSKVMYKPECHTSKNQTRNAALKISDISFFPDRWDSLPKKISVDEEVVKIENKPESVKVSFLSTAADSFQVSSPIRKKLLEAGIHDIDKPTKVELTYPKTSDCGRLFEASEYCIYPKYYPETNDTLSRCTRAMNILSEDSNTNTKNKTMMEYPRTQDRLSQSIRSGNSKVRYYHMDFSPFPDRGFYVPKGGKDNGNCVRSR